MPTVKNAELSITTDRPRDQATVIVTCDIEFTEVEVNAMNILGLRYLLQAQVLNKYLLDADPVLTYPHHSFPRSNGARRHEHPVFASDVPLYTLNERVFGKDKLVAELTLTNVESGTEQVLRTEEIAIDLAA
jgi:hypothetical protein